MDWHRSTVEGEDGAGVGAVLARLRRELGGPPPSGTRLVTDATGMRRATREIEAAALAAGPEAELRAGFQRAERFAEEAARYATLAAEGVRVTAYGLGEPDPPVAGVRWVRLRPDRTDLANQWFVVLLGPEPVAMAGWETTAGPHGLGSTADPARSFAGFTTGDPRVVEAMAAYLRTRDPVPAAPRPGRVGDPRDDLPALLSGELHPGRAAELRGLLGTGDDLRRDLAEIAWVAGALRDTARLELPDPSELPPLVLPGTRPARPAALVLAATNDGRDPVYAGSRAAGLELARTGGGHLLLYDRSPELYLVDPYRGDGPMDEGEAAASGRDYLAGQLREAAAAGIRASAWVARGAGPAALADCAAALPGAEVVLPATLARPGLLDRVRAHSAGALTAGLPARLRLADERGRLIPA